MRSKIKTCRASDDAMRVNKLFTLVFLKKNNSVLLGLKTRGLGKGLWNGFGGKVEANESLVECAKRELKEECDLLAVDLKHLGVVRYDLLYQNSADVVHVFTCTQFEGTARGSEEMNPVRWYNFSDIPFGQMWPDASIWWSSMLAEKYFSARVTYDDTKKITDSVVGEHGDLADALKLAE